MEFTFVDAVAVCVYNRASLERRFSGCRSGTDTAEMLRALLPPKKAQPPFDGVASLVVDRGAGTELRSKLWSSPAWVL